jgi:hypothetical protein
MFQKELDTIPDLLTLIKKHILKRAGGHKLSLGIHEVSGRKRILNRSLRLGLNHLVKVVSMSTQLICHPALVIGIAGIHKGLEMLDIMFVAIELELDHLGGTVCDLEVHELKIDIIVQADGLKLVREIVVICDT